ncbi:MAG: ankyrin repeat domain-containing protein [Alphaproteobacteria bacterium]
MAHKPVLTAQQQSAFNTALQTGIQRKDMDMIKLALNNGAEPNILLFAGIDFKATWKDKFNYTTPLQFAIDYVKTAVEYGADVNAIRTNAEKKPWPALHWVFSNFNQEVSDYMMEQGAPVDTPSPFGHTLLVYAIFNGNSDLVKYYLEKGADPMCPCGENKETFPLKILQDSDKFKPNKKAELVTLMMQHIKPAAETPAAAAEAAPSEVVLAQDIEVSHAVTLKTHAVEKPGKNFSL